MYNPKILSENIRKYRKKRGLTQSQLAEKLFITAQNVSKWELGASSPDINNLCAMAEVFGISVDSFLYGLSESTSKVMLAVDGGGTKTEFLLFNDKGEVFNRFTAGCSNPNVCTINTTCEILKHGIETCLLQNKSLYAVSAGIAGCGTDTNAKAVTSRLSRLYPDIKFNIGSDILNVIYSAEPMDKCLAVICGTGSIAYAKTGNTLHRMGGWGYLFSQGGSGYDLGCDAIRAALADIDGFGEKTLITGLAEKKVGGNIVENINVLYASGKDYIASFAPVVFEAYEKGDKKAKEILERNAKQLAFLINTANQKYDCGDTVILSGGIISNQPSFKSAVLEKVNPALRLVFPSVPQVLGAAAGCFLKFSRPDENFKEILESNYNKFLAENI